MLITFSGVDGSGKSTQVDFAIQWLQNRGYSPIQLHLTQWTWVYKIGELIGQKEKMGGETAVVKPPPTSVKIIRQLVTLIDLQRFKWMWSSMRRKRMVLVCDRYFYDLGVNALYRQSMSSTFVNFVWKYAPTPDIAFLLDANPASAQAREGEHVAAYYVQKRQLYLYSSAAWPTTMVKSSSIIQTQAEVEQHLSTYLKSDH